MPREMSDAFPEAAWIVCRSDEQEAMVRRYNAGFTDSQPDETGYIEPDDVYRHAMDSIKQIRCNCNAVEVWPRQLVEGNWQPLIEMVERAGKSWDQEKVDLFADIETYKLNLPK